MGRHKELAFIIPAHNEAETIKITYASLCKLADVVIVDDCSTDTTKNIAKNISNHVITHKKKLGYSKAILTGLDYACRAGFRYAITIDADGQHDPKDAIKIISQLKKGDALVIGARPNSGRASETFFSFFYNKLFGIKDPFSGLKGFSLEKLQLHFYNSQEIDMGLRTINFCLKKGLQISEFPITVRQRKAGKSRVGGAIIGNLRICMCGKSLIQIIGCGMYHRKRSHTQIEYRKRS